MNKELLEALNVLEKEKEISKDTLLAVSYTHQTLPTKRIV